MNYWLDGHDRETAVKDMLICLLPWETHIKTDEQAENWALSRFRREAGYFIADAVVRRSGRETHGECEMPGPADPSDDVRVQTRAVKTALYKALLPHLDSPPPWGAITGVKPAKPVRMAMEQGLDEQGALRLLTEEYFVSPARARLSIKGAAAAIACERSLLPGELQVYAGIPFCPTKCSYCSFVSNDVRRWGHLIEPYLDALIEEIRVTGAGVRMIGAPVGSIYVGGGTPTILTEDQLTRLLSELRKSFNFEKINEITLEGGRPDTISEQKLHIIREMGVTRLSINPQSMDDRVLLKVGRMHTVADIERVFEQSRRICPEVAVNMDLIAGLPGDTPEGLRESVRRVSKLRPENITIHSLARKRGAALRDTGGEELHPEDLDVCYADLEALGYQVYYLYKQKYSAGGLENVGFTLPGYSSRYNICMMEELGSVVAMGSGGVTKLLTLNGREVRRVTNPKYPLEYIAEQQNICNRKVRIFSD